MTNELLYSCFVAVIRPRPGSAEVEILFVSSPDLGITSKALLCAYNDLVRSQSPVGLDHTT